MKRLDSILLKIFLFGLPVVAIIIATFFLNPEEIKQGNTFIRWMWDFAGLIFATWMVLSIYLSIRLMISEIFRDYVLARITFMQERDEREVLLTGRATRATFLTSLAILIFLFFLSCFQVSIGKLPPDKSIDGKHHYLSLGIGFKFLESSKSDMAKDTTNNEDIFSYKCLPFSSTTLIVILILWQIIAYNYSMRRLTKSKMG
jgi:hypothetical protein